MDLKVFIEEIEKQKLNVEGIVVLKGSMEPVCHRWKPEQRRTIYSVSKSFLSIAVGMAIDEGKLRLSDRLCQAFPREIISGEPEESAARWEAVSLEHLLTMTIGHPEFSRPRSVSQAMGYRLTRDPGSYFFYDNTCSLLASAMLTKATGQKAKDYLLDRLFRPLGISDPEWEESDDGHTIGVTGLVLNTSEMALFGRFLLQRGSWEGKQLVSSAWIEMATRTQVPTRPSQKLADYDLGYGYQFWTCRHGAYRCDGRDGQFIIVFPAFEAVVAINSSEENMEPILWAVWDCILPELRL